VSMFIRERDDAFIMINQHDHARLSHDIFLKLKLTFFENKDYLPELQLAVREHDRGWIGLDAVPLWDEAKQAPYSFIDYPLLPKLASYKLGLDEIEARSPYGCLLCSMHYVSFFLKDEQPVAMKFVANERERQSAIMKKLHLIHDDQLNLHFRILQFCDDLSVFVCLNEPGNNKGAEHPWFINGIPNSNILNENKAKPIMVSWLNDHCLKIASFPFDNDFTASLKFKSVAKNRIEELGLAYAFAEKEYLEQVLTFTK
jgi:hypothetical protein